MKKFTTIGILILLLLCMPFAISEVLAQPPPPTGPPCWPPPCVPVDGGISFLLVAAAAYGGKKIYDSKKQNTSKAE